MKVFILLFSLFVFFVIYVNRNLLKKARPKSINDLKLETYEEQIETLKDQIYELKMHGNRKHPIVTEHQETIHKVDDEKLEALKEENKILKQKVKKLEYYIKELELGTEKENEILEIKEDEEGSENNLVINESNNIEYINFVAGHYKLEGYDIYLNKTKNDEYKELDVVCRRDKNVIFLKCELLEENNMISYKRLEVFVHSCKKYIQNQNIKNKTIQLRLVIPNDGLNYPERKYIKETENLEYEIL